MRGRLSRRRGRCQLGRVGQHACACGIARQNTTADVAAWVDWFGNGASQKSQRIAFKLVRGALLYVWAGAQGEEAEAGCRGAPVSVVSGGVYY